MLYSAEFCFCTSGAKHTTRFGFFDVSKLEGIVEGLSRLRQVWVVKGRRIALKPLLAQKSSKKPRGCAHKPWGQRCSVSQPARQLPIIAVFLWPCKLKIGPGLKLILSLLLLDSNAKYTYDCRASKFASQRLLALPIFSL